MSDNNTIVLPIDFSGMSLAALPWARRMAAVTGGKVHCVYSVEQPQVYSALDMAPAIPLPTVEELTNNARQQLVAFADEHLAEIETVAEVLVGKPSQQIIEYARQVDAAMIIMSTHGYSGLEHVVLGSTTEAVVRKAHCPVLSIRSK